MTQRIFTQTFGVVGAIIERDGKILLVKEGQGKHDMGKWNQPAGWIEVGEDPIEAVKKEVKEETGLEFEPTALIGIYSLHRQDLKGILGATPHALKFIFRGKTVGGELIERNEEISELKWFTKDEIDRMGIETLRDIDIKQEVADYFAGKFYPLEIIHHTAQSVE